MRTENVKTIAINPMSRNQRGTNLVEVMVALLILSIGLLGLAMLQIQGLKYNTDSYLRTQATFMANEIIERIRANSGAAATYTGSTPASLSKDCATNQCTATETALYDLYYWDMALKDPTNGLPSVNYEINANGGNSYEIVMKWREQKDKEGVANVVTQTWTIEL